MCRQVGPNGRDSAVHQAFAWKIRFGELFNGSFVFYDGLRHQERLRAVEGHHLPCRHDRDRGP